MKTSKPSFQTPTSLSRTSEVHQVCPHCKQKVVDDDYCELHGMIISIRSNVVNRFYPQQLTFVGVIT